jgi:hypothetical protein
MPDNPYLTVAAPNYATPIINWFGQHPENVGQRMNMAPPAARPGAPPQPGPTSAYWDFASWLQKQFGLGPPPVQAQGQNPESGGMGLPQGTQTGSLY